MKICITGGAGFIGSNLSLFYTSQNHEVFSIDNLITGSLDNIKSLESNPLFHFIQADIINFNFSQIPQCDIVYHLACPASPIQYKKFPLETLLVSSEGTRKVLEFVKSSNSHIFVLASTSEVYGDPIEHPQKETYWGNVNPSGIRSCYDEGKRYAEAITMTMFRLYKLDVRIARIFNTYGPLMEKNDGRVVSNFIMQALKKRPITIYGDGQQTRSFCYVSDMVQGLHLLGTVKNLSGNTVNLGNPDEYSILELAKIIKKTIKTSSKIIYNPIDEDDPKKRNPDISKANRLLHWNPVVPFSQGLLKTITYFKNKYL